MTTKTRSWPLAAFCAACITIGGSIGLAGARYLDRQGMCAVQVLTSEERIRDQVRRVDRTAHIMRLERAVAAANAAAENKLGVLARELGILAQRDRGLPTSWTVTEIVP